MRSHRRPHIRKHADRSSHRLLLALIDLYQLLRTPQPIDSLLQSILDTAIAHVPGAQRGSLLVLDGEQLCYRATYGYDLDQLRMVSFPAQLAQAIAFQGSRVIQVSDFVSMDYAFLSPEQNRILIEYGHVFEIRRTLVTAITVRGQLYGSLMLDNLRSHAPFPPTAETLALLLAEQAGALLEQAQLIERLRQTSTMLVESEKLAALGRFIASIAHEINNPLTAVIGYTDFLAETDLSADNQWMLEQVRIGAERVRTIVRNLQLFARQQRSGEMSVNLNLIVEQGLTLKRSDYTLDMIEMQADLDPHLPLIWADGGQLSQVLLNLLVNAQHALRQREPPRTLHIRTWHEGDDAKPERLLLSVRDNGPGIPPEVIGRVFEPFFTTRPPGQGTGLGLSICTEIVQHHRGSIRVVSTPGAGAEFIVELPIRSVSAVVDPLPQPAPARQAASPTGLRILVVEDDPGVQTLIQHTLGNTNDMVITSSAIEALALIDSLHFDLVLCDLKMPEMSGEMLYRQVQARQPQLAPRFLFISGDTSNAATRAFLTEAGRPLLAKPFTAADLFGTIAGVLAIG